LKHCHKSIVAAHTQKDAQSSSSDAAALPVYPFKRVRHYYGQKEIFSSRPFCHLTTVKSRKISTLQFGRSIMAYFTYRGGLRPALTDEFNRRSDAYSRMMTARQDLETTLGEGARSSRHTGTNVRTAPLPIASQDSHSSRGSAYENASVDAPDGKDRMRKTTKLPINEIRRQVRRKHAITTNTIKNMIL
jgi:hypothetical protein